MVFYDVNIRLDKEMDQREMKILEEDAKNRFEEYKLTASFETLNYLILNYLETLAAITLESLDESPDKPLDYILTHSEDLYGGRLFFNLDINLDGVADLNSSTGEIENFLNKSDFFTEYFLDVLINQEDANKFDRSSDSAFQMSHELVKAPIDQLFSESIDDFLELNKAVKMFLQQAICYKIYTTISDALMMSGENISKIRNRIKTIDLCLKFDSTIDLKRFILLDQLKRRHRDYFDKKGLSSSQLLQSC